MMRAGRFMAFGMEFGITVVAGVLAGYYLDQWAKTAPWLTLLFTLGALFGALYRLMAMLKRYQ